MASSTATTFRVSDTTPNQHYYFGNAKIQSPQDQITHLPHYRGNNCKEILQMSDFPKRTFFSDNGFCEYRGGLLQPSL